MILVDTSAWVEFDRATGSPTDKYLTGLIASDAGIAVTEPVLMEFLAGARDDAATRQLRRLLTSFYWIPADAGTDFEGAATAYRKCRAAGITPRGLVNCLVVAIAIRTGSKVLAAHSDFARMATILPLRIESVPA
jgi:hypothetical protein